MSFLYQALIKQKQQGVDIDTNGQVIRENNPEGQQQASFQQQGAALTLYSPVTSGQGSFYLNASGDSQQHKSHWFWLVIAGLLMIVGLLAGYLFATKQQAIAPSTPEQVQLMQQQLLLQQDLAELKQSNDALLDKVDTALVATTTNSVAVEPASNMQGASEGVDKQVNVALDSNGQIQTQVSSTFEPAAVEPEPLQRSSVKDVDLADIPEKLKSSFADAVKATEQKSQPELFTAKIDAGSSLPLLSELSLAQIYWVPDMEYQMHIYASNPSERWVRINGQTLNEGDQLTPELTLLEIRQEQIIWQGKDRRFAHDALTDFVKTH